MGDHSGDGVFPGSEEDLPACPEVATAPDQPSAPEIAGVPSQVRINDFMNSG